MENSQNRYKIIRQQAAPLQEIEKRLSVLQQM